MVAVVVSSSFKREGAGIFACKKAAPLLGSLPPPMMLLEIAERIEIIINTVSFLLFVVLFVVVSGGVRFYSSK